jgi:hypothetical protein
MSDWTLIFIVFAAYMVAGISDDKTEQRLAQQKGKPHHQEWRIK